MTDDIQPLIDHLSATTALPEPQAQRLVEEVLAYLSETVEDWVTRRHAELQARGERNSAIFEILASELQHRRFKSGPLTQRQLRRLIYG